MNIHPPDFEKLSRTAWLDLESSARNKHLKDAEEALSRLTKLDALHRQAIAIQTQLQELGKKPADVKMPPRAVPTSIDRSEDLEFLLTRALDERRKPSNRPREVTVANSIYAVSKSNELPVVAANWVIDHGGKLPILRNFVHETASGFGPSAQLRRLKDGKYIEIGDSQSKLIEKARRILNSCGFSDTPIKITFEDGSTKVA